MKTHKARKPAVRERHWITFNNGCVRGIQHSQLTLVRSTPHESIVRDTVAVISLTKPAAFIAALTIVTVLMLLLTGCHMVRGQQGGTASVVVGRNGHTNTFHLAQSENPKEPAHQSVQSDQTIEYVIPPGSALALPGPVGSSPVGGPTTGACVAYTQQPMPVRVVSMDRAETSIGGAQKDTLREWAGKAANLQPVLWAGILMMTVVAGALAYFGWWTKAGLAVGIGLGMVLLAQTLRGHETAILLGGLGVFGVLSLIILYAYNKGQLDQNHNGIPDILERRPTSSTPAS